MIGHHAVGDSARHRLVPVSEALRSVADAASIKDPILEARKAAIETRLQALKERAKSVLDNAAAVQVSLEDAHRKALADLQSLTKSKLNVIRGDNREVLRQLAEIEALDAFLAYQQASPAAGPEFILGWTHHQRLRAELQAFNYTHEIDVQADLRVSGSIQVICGASESTTSNAGAGLGGGDPNPNSFGAKKPSILGRSPTTRTLQNGTPSIFDLSLAIKKPATQQNVQLSSAMDYFMKE